MSLQHLPRRPTHPLRPMPLRKHAQLPQRTPERIRHLRVVDVRAVHAVPRAVLGREQRLELRVALDERGDARERARKEKDARLEELRLERLREQEELEEERRRHQERLAREREEDSGLYCIIC